MNINWSKLWDRRFKIILVSLGIIAIICGSILSFCLEGKIEILAGLFGIVIGVAIKPEEREEEKSDRFN